MDEAQLLAHIYARSQSAQHDRVSVGPGDDCAVVDCGGDRAVLLTTDQLIEGRHFIPDTHQEHIAWKALARSVSDIAACAGQPICALATCALPAGYENPDALFDAMHKAAQEMNCPLVGGDIAFTTEDQSAPLHISTTVVGCVHAERGAVLRSGAKPGDAIVITGTIGGSFDRRLTSRGVPHHLGFMPRVSEARALADVVRGGLHAMMDVSDGLGVDAGRLALASGVSIDLNAESLPISCVLDEESNRIERGISDGEDYELLCAVHPNGVEAALALGCSVIGTVREPTRDAPRGAVLLNDAVAPVRRVDSHGYVHSGGSV